ncbi:MAG: hypothetical protein NUV61_03035 [Candidatus Azambacteria bacterium]|nr:hypothetical protein [Candidatus Azambacteria bacterium]
MKRVSFILTDRLEEMAQELINARGYSTITSLIHSAIIDMHTSAFPVYLRKIALRDEDPADRVRRKQEEKDAKRDMVLEEVRDIAFKLGGTITSNGEKETCTYFTYIGKKRFEQIIPISFLSEDLLKTQYSPNKEKVLQLQKEGKVDY